MRSPSCGEDLNTYVIQSLRAFRRAELRLEARAVFSVSVFSGPLPRPIEVVSFILYASRVPTSQVIGELICITQDEESVSIFVSLLYELLVIQR